MHAAAAARLDIRIVMMVDRTVIMSRLAMMRRCGSRHHGGQVHQHHRDGEGA